MARKDLEGRLPIVYNGKSVEEWYRLYCEQIRVSDAAIKVLRASSKGDQNFINCLQGDDVDTVVLRRTLIKLGETLMEERSDD